MKKLLCLVFALLFTLSACAYAAAASDYEKALNYFQKANYKKAAKLFRELGEDGDLSACMYLTYIYGTYLTKEASAAENYEYWNKKASNIMDDMFNQSIVLSDRGDDEAAVEILTELVSYEHPNALNSLGVRYKNGTGVSKDLKRAYEYISRSAELNNPYAAYNMGLAYEHGDYVWENLKKALTYYKQAEELGYKDAAAAIKRVEAELSKPTPTPRPKNTPTPKPTSSGSSDKKVYNRITNGSSSSSDSIFHITPDSSGKKIYNRITYGSDSSSSSSNSIFHIVPDNSDSSFPNFEPTCPICNDMRRCQVCSGFGDIMGETCPECRGRGTCTRCAYWMNR